MVDLLVTATLLFVTRQMIFFRMAHDVILLSFRSSFLVL